MDIPKDVQVIETRTEKIWLGKDGIIRYSVIPTGEHSLEDAKENFAAGLKLCGQAATPSVIDIRGIRNISRDARNFYASKENARVMSAVALLTSSPVSKIIGNFFLGLNKPVFPTKLFTSEEKAIEWLKQYL